MTALNTPAAGISQLVYYSSRSGNTARFVAALDLPSLRLPEAMDPCPEVTTPYVLVCPTYADGEGRGAVPKQVIHFLNNPANRARLIGVIGTGNRNFGTTFALAGRVIAQKCNVPLLDRIELAGTASDISRVRAGLIKLGNDLCSTTAC